MRDKTMRDKTMGDKTMGLVAMLACGFFVTPLVAQDKKPAPDPANRQVFFGEQHLHTTASTDAYIQGNHKNTIDDAFNYNKGLPVKKYLTGETLQRKTPYDWTAVTDHSEYLGLLNRLSENPPPVSPDDPIVKARQDVANAPEDASAHLTLAKTLGEGFEGRNSTHSIKKMTKQQLLDLRDRLHLHEEIPEESIEKDRSSFNAIWAAERQLIGTGRTS